MLGLCAALRAVSGLAEGTPLRLDILAFSTEWKRNSSKLLCQFGFRVLRTDFGNWFHCRGRSRRFHGDCYKGPD